MKKRQMNYENDKELTAKRLREAMDDIGITATELSEKSKVHKASISQYLHATQSPSNISASALAKVLGVNPMWLMGFDTQKEKTEPISYIVYNPTQEEVALIEKYRMLPEKDRTYIFETIERIYTYQQKLKDILNEDGGGKNEKT